MVIYSQARFCWDWCVSDFQLIRSSEKSHFSVFYCGSGQHLAGLNARRVSSECENVTKHAALIWQGQLWKWYDNVRYIRSGWLSHTKRSSCLRLLTHIHNSSLVGWYVQCMHSPIGAFYRCCWAIDDGYLEIFLKLIHLLMLTRAKWPILTHSVHFMNHRPFQRT